MEPRGEHEHVERDSPSGDAAREHEKILFPRSTRKKRRTLE
jgi:hypothetical protein